MGGRAEGLACADPGARTPIGAIRNISYFSYFCLYLLVKVNPKTFQPPTQNEPHTILRVDANREGMVPDDHLRYCVKIKYCASIIYLQIKY